MNDNGEPEHVGEIRYQAGSFAVAVPSPDGLRWSVQRSHDGLVRYTDRLAHADHWTETEGEVRPAPAPPPLESVPMDSTALFYPDVSNNNWRSVGDALYFLSQLVPEGFSAVVHKVSEGSYYEDPFWPPVRDWCADNGLLCLGYHYVTTDDPGAQAATWNDNGGGPNAMFDWEANSGNLGNFWNVTNGFNAGGVNITLGYCPEWYWSEVGGGDLGELAANQIGLVSSAYPISGANYASSIFASAGGDCGEGFTPYGGGTPAAWQFTDRAIIAGFSVDCNAFLGTPAELQQLFTTGTFS